MIYYDSSALVKLVVSEAESAALAAWNAAHASTVRISSALVRVELVRAVGAHDPAHVTQVRELVGSLALVPVSDAVLDTAGALRHELRSLDAIHLSAALTLRDAGLETLVAYDKRLLAAAEQAGLHTASPGAS